MYQSCFLVLLGYNYKNFLCCNCLIRFNRWKDLPCWRQCWRKSCRFGSHESCRLWNSTSRRHLVYLRLSIHQLYSVAISPSGFDGPSDSHGSSGHLSSRYKKTETLYIFNFQNYCSSSPTSFQFTSVSIRKKLITLLSPWDENVPQEFTYELTRFRHIAGAFQLACTQQTHCSIHPLSLVYVQVESGRVRAREEISGSTDHFQQFWNGYGRKKLKCLMIRTWYVKRGLREEMHGITWQMGINTFVKERWCNDTIFKNIKNMAWIHKKLK